MGIEEKLQYLGYKRIGVIDLQFLVNLLSNLPVLYMSQEKKKFKDFEPITLDEVIKDGMAFYDKYFDLHDVDHLSLQTFKENINGICESNSCKNAYSKYYGLLKKVSPFDIPIELVFGHSMVGYVRNPLLVIPGCCYCFSRRVPFDIIGLGSDLTKVSSATYVNEISDTQIESNIGACEDYLNKEVISIFLEKLSAYELDPTLELLKAQERMRYAHMYECIRMGSFSIVDTTGSVQQQRAIDSFMYVNSCIIAERLFDDYLKCKTQEERDSYIIGIQKIYDGMITVEEFLGKKGITLENSVDYKVLKKHISMN